MKLTKKRLLRTIAFENRGKTRIAIGAHTHTRDGILCTRGCSCRHLDLETAQFYGLMKNGTAAYMYIYTRRGRPTASRGIIKARAEAPHRVKEPTDRAAAPLFAPATLRTRDCTGRMDIISYI